ncbi:MAG: hypothetical protein QOE03_4180, partial [Micromonosporaceae bacterium]|nr:hypothetical protein [Micromonosporaceae bacterium]
NHGGLSRYSHEVVGFNSRLDSLQAVVLRAKLARLAAWTQARRAAAARYDGLLDGLEVIRPVTAAGNEHVWHLYVIRVGDGRRDAVVAALNAAGIGAGIHYPVPVHRTGAFGDLGYGAGDFPHAERAAAEILSLPLYPQITAAQQETVVRELRRALNAAPARLADAFLADVRTADVRTADARAADARAADVRAADVRAADGRTAPRAAR